MRIIDAHVHVLENFAPMTPFEDLGRPDRLLALMDDEGVEKAVMLPVGEDFSPRNNEECAQWARAHPDRLVTLTDVDLHQPEAAPQIAQAREQFGAVGISCYQEITGLDGPASDPVWEALQTHELVCSLHVQPPHYGLLLELVRTHPDIRFVLNHLGLPGALDPTDPEYGGLLPGAAQPNLYIKASGFYAAAATPWDFRCPQALGFFSRLLQGLGPERLLWGSDWPPVSRHLTYRQSLEIVRTAAALENFDQALVLGENAARVFQI